MKKWFLDEEVQKKIFTYTVTGILVIICYFIIREFKVVSDFISKLLKVLSPFIYGIGLAFLLFPLFRQLLKLFGKKRRFKEVSAAILTIIILLAIVALFFAILLPQLISSITQLINIIYSFINDTSSWLDIFDHSLIPDYIINWFSDYAKSILVFVIDFVQTQVPNLLKTAASTVGTIGNIVIGLIVALYIMLDHVNLKRQIKKLALAIFNKRQYKRLSKVYYLTIDKFSGFVVGKLIDSLIIGIICFIVMSIFKMEYAVLISFIVGITNIIPFFGPFIGAIPSLFILLIVNPLQALWFLVIILVIQQLDGNIIGPFILGDSLGLSSLWIMFAIIVSGAYFGIVGMILGVPIFAVIFFLLKEFVDKRLKQKEIEL